MAEAAELELASFWEAAAALAVPELGSRQSMNSSSRSQPRIPGARIGDARHTRAICLRETSFVDLESEMDFGFITFVRLRYNYKKKKKKTAGRKQSVSIYAQNR